MQLYEKLAQYFMVILFHQTYEINRPLSLLLWVLCNDDVKAVTSDNWWELLVGVTATKSLW